MAMTPGSDDSMMSEINVTPLVDVMLVLLTVFIVTAPLLMNAVPVTLPKATTDASIPQLKSVRISVTGDGTLYFNDTALSADALNVRLKQAAQNKDISVEIFADERVEYGIVAKVMAATQRAGISKFTFVMLPDASK
ncbi:ExbD/TolR family protein [Methylobacillus flagellatus]|uniref:ExbD/TolR family protein n=1 Tax=Methylobacillus flagellatus TaxID=405 RepID=UPI0010F95702|nr:biopolymer transporter ExbD [Methylobacillus flagellatus]